MNFRTLLRNLIALTSCSCLYAAPMAHADDAFSTFADIGVYSQYLSRSTPYGKGVSVQGDVGLKHSSGVSISTWFATGAIDGKDIEYDFILDYSGKSYGVGYSIGYYTFRYFKRTNLNAGEFYSSLTYQFVKAGFYVGKGYNYFYVKPSYAINDLLHTSLAVGYNDSKKKSDVTLSLSSGFPMGGTTVSPSASVAKLEGAKVEWAVGFNVSF